MIEIVVWFGVTLVLATFACMLAKRIGPGFLVAVYAVSLIISTVVAAKIVPVGPFTASASVALYSLTFLCTDTISEFWGKRQARNAIWAGLFAQGLFIVMIQMAVALPYAEFWTGQAALEEALKGTWRVALASIVAFVVAQNTDVVIYHLLKDKTKGKFLWLRNNFSTVSGQVIDTLLFYTIAFYGMFPIGGLIISTIILKMIIALIDTPFMYAIRFVFQRGKKWVAA